MLSKLSKVSFQANSFCWQKSSFINFGSWQHGTDSEVFMFTGFHLEEHWGEILPSTFQHIGWVLFSALIMCHCWLYLQLQNISSDIIGFTGDEATRRNLKSLIKTLSRLLWRCYECRNRIAAHWPSFHKVVSILRKRKKKEACRDPGRSSGSFWPLTYRCLVVMATWVFVCFFPLFFFFPFPFPVLSFPSIV